MHARTDSGARARPTQLYMLNAERDFLMKTMTMMTMMTMRTMRTMRTMMTMTMTTTTTISDVHTGDHWDHR